MRTVSYLAGGRGIRQFLDIGVGLPTACNTHEVAQRIAPESRIVYVDNYPMVLSHARAADQRPAGVTSYVEADLRDPAIILAQAAEALDFTQPVAVMLLAILDYIPGLDQVRRILARLLAAVPPGSFLVISHAASDLDPGETAEMTRRLNEHLRRRPAPRLCRHQQNIHPHRQASSSRTSSRPLAGTARHTWTPSRSRRKRPGPHITLSDRTGREERGRSRRPVLQRSLRYGPLDVYRTDRFGRAARL